MDEAIGVVNDAQALIEGDRIHSVVASAAAAATDTDDDVFDGLGFTVFPGFINAHMHTWQTALRGMASNWTLLEYFRWMHAGLATLFTPADIYVGTLAGALNQLQCGTTTLSSNGVTTIRRPSIQTLLLTPLNAVVFEQRSSMAVPNPIRGPDNVRSGK
jgi:cytosine/adenosine deaminase-related metal-dependent hydrolase